MKFIQSALFLFFATSLVEGELKSSQQRRQLLNTKKNRQSASTENLQTCAEVDYTMSVAVEDFHVVIAAEPDCGSLRNREVCKQCPGFAFHTGNMAHDNDDIVLGKQIFELSEEHDDMERLPLKKITLENLIAAFEDTPMEAEPYSFSDNNCATFLIDLGAKVGVDPTDPAIVEFVSRKLSQEAGSVMVEQLSDEMIDGRGQDAVIEDFVADYIHARV